MKRPLRAIAAVLALFAMTVPPAWAQDVPSVTMQPADPTGVGPNNGQWFVFDIAPGESAQGRVSIFNPAPVAQSVELGVRDLTFDDTGTPSAALGGEQLDIGAWAELTQSSVTVPPGQSVPVDFTLSLPADAEPGDHIGVITATTTAQNGNFAVDRRIARRLYVTVPGEATRSYEIESVDAAVDSYLFPSRLFVRTALRNTGRIRLRPEVSIAGATASGSPLLLAQSVEIYEAELPISWWKIIHRVDVESITRDGITRRTSVTRIAFPVGAAALAIVAAGAALAARRMWRRRVGRIAALTNDIARLERLVRDRGATGPVESTIAGGMELERIQRRESLARARRLHDGPAIAHIGMSLLLTDPLEAEGLLEESLRAGAGEAEQAVRHALASITRPQPEPVSPTPPEPTTRSTTSSATATATVAETVTARRVDIFSPPATPEPNTILPPPQGDAMPFAPPAREADAPAASVSAHAALLPEAQVQAQPVDAELHAFLCCFMHEEQASAITAHFPTFEMITAASMLELADIDDVGPGLALKVRAEVRRLAT